MSKTLYEKLWESHVVCTTGSGSCLLYIDRHYLHEVSTPQSFESLRTDKLSVRRPETNIAVADHSVPTRRDGRPIADPQAAAQIALLEQNCLDFSIPYIPLDSDEQGIVHVIGPEQGLSLPGMTIVCGDSHTSTHGAFGALAFGIGASECGTVMATQCLLQKQARSMRVHFTGRLQDGITAKDLALALIAKIGTAGAVGHAIEFTGEPIRNLSMEGRMTLCNMAIEAGSRTGLVAPDETTLEYIKGRKGAPKGEDWDKACAYWATLQSDSKASYDKEVELCVTSILPQVTYGTRPDQSLPDNGWIPASLTDDARNALTYMGIEPETEFDQIGIDYAFIGSCTNGRIEDLRAAAAQIKGRHVAHGVTALVVPGSGLVKKQAEAEGLDRLFLDAGFEWRAPGCSLCVAMNDDRLPAGSRCASTSNRNFEGRQGVGSRTHLMSPLMAAEAAINGRIVRTMGTGS
ncbi:3-isopropylmalate dehydratase large subunit [Hyphomonas sp.]|uniref:3-isopropylmalate dehydratase large subunit n=1 Tax=Hyphomonas sp. TaxID=87 RepID=UPI0030FCA358